MPAIIMAIFIMISTFWMQQWPIMTAPRVYYAMAKDGLFFRKAGELNKNGVPGFAIVVQGVWSVLLVCQAHMEIFLITLSLQF